MMTGMRHITDPAMFERFHNALTSERGGYVPWYFLLSKGFKDPAAGISWKQLEGRLTFEQAVKKMRAGHNIGIAATGMDALCIVDVDDIEATPDEIVKPTLSTRSRKRIGMHYFYFTDDPRCKENLPTEGKGEIRSSFEYVVAPGSYVLCDDKTIAAMPELERGFAGRYTVENERSPDTIVFEELPPVFLEQAQKNREAGKEAQLKRIEKAKARKDKKPAQGGDKNKSAMWDLSIDDVTSIPNKTRFKSLFHESTTGKNTALNSDGGLTCWRHLVTHTPLSALAVLAGVSDCLDAGQGINKGKSSCIDYTDGITLFKMWAFAKREGMITKLDPIPAEALRWYAVDNGICKYDEIVDGWKLPAGAYSQTLKAIEDKEKLSTGRQPIKPAAEAAPVADMACTDRLIELGTQGAVFFHTPDDTCYAAVELDSGGSAIYPLNEKSRQFKRILKHRYYNATGKAPAAEPMKAAIGVLESIAAFEGETIELHNRVAWHNGNIAYDLTTANYGAIEITTQGWGMMAPGHILFRRFGHQIPQTHPVSGGDVWRLYEFVNVSESDRLLDMVHLISCLVPGIPHPIPITTGEHGSTKTTACKIKKALIDPSDLDVIALQPNEERMVQMLYHHWFVIFDNVTYLQQWQSDVLCRACTGEGTVKRTLYTNEDDTIFKYKRCIGLNGINNAATKPDLLDRAFILNHEPIPKDRRIEERVLFERFNEAKPGILGGMFDALSEAMRIYPTIELKEKPRMADFAVWGCAIAEALGHTKEKFLMAYMTNIGGVNRTALEESPVGLCILSFMEDLPEWLGTPSQLHNELEMIADGLHIDKKSNTWAKSPRSLGKKIRLIIPNLREEGIMVETQNSGDRNIRIVNRLYSEKETPKTPKTPADSDSGADSKRPQTPETPNKTPDIDESGVTQTPESHKRPTNAQKKTATGEGVGRLSVSGVSAPTLKNMGACGKCGCNLSGQTFQGPAGLGLICANCQAELDQASGLGTITGEQLATMIKSAIYKLGYVRDIHDFTAVEVQMELPKGTGITTEKIKTYLATHTADLKITRPAGGKWRQVSA